MIDNFSQSYKNVLLSARNLGLCFYDEPNLINRYSNPKYLRQLNNIKIFRDKDMSSNKTILLLIYGIGRSTQETNSSINSFVDRLRLLTSDLRIIYF